MRKKLVAGALAVIMALSAASNVTATASNQAAKEPEAWPPVETTAITDAEAKLSLGGAYEVVGGSAQNGWVYLIDASGKGYGSPWVALNLDKKLYVSGMEGAEVYVGASGILRFEWTEAGGEKDVDPYDVWFGESEGDSKEYTLSALRYDWNGELIETKELGTHVQGDGDLYSSELESAMEEEIRAAGVNQSEYPERIEFRDEDGDAVGYNDDGDELIRYPETPAEEIYYAVISKDGSFMSVALDYPKNRTEIYSFVHDESQISEDGINYNDTAIIKQVQEALNAAGYDCGTPDGVSGKKTKTAINDFREEKGLKKNGKIDAELMEALGL